MSDRKNKKEHSDEMPVNLSNTLEEGFTIRLRALNELKDKYHPMYTSLNQYKAQQREKVLEQIVSMYIPNVMRDFPFLLERIDTQKKYIKHIEKERDLYLEQKNKAYKKLGLKISQFHDTWDPSFDLEEENEKGVKRKSKKQVE